VWCPFVMYMLSVSLCVSVVAGVCVTSEVIKRRVQEGGSTSIECPYDQGYETYPKYFFKGIWAHKVPTRVRKNYFEGRYSINDFGNGYFNVTIKDLERSDYGTYWCGVERDGVDSYQKVYLSVEEGMCSCGCFNRE
uniref:Ig-like domain-containing protein n=1 Tax=Esox lucius TaxID=8010 RepID=A0AAY5KL42_ESOLU